MNDGSNTERKFHEDGCEYVEYLDRQEQEEQEKNEEEEDADTKS